MKIISAVLICMVIYLKIRVNSNQAELAQLRNQLQSIAEQHKADKQAFELVKKTNAKTTQKQNQIRAKIKTTPHSSDAAVAVAVLQKTLNELREIKP